MAVSVSSSRGRSAPRLGAAARFATPTVAVGLAVVVTAAWFAWQSGHMNTYVWLVDELLYVRNAMSYADLQGLWPHVMGEPHGVPNVLLAVLMAPLYALFDGETAFTLAHVLQGIVWATVIVPVYLILRRLGVGWGWALLGGLLTAWVPYATATLVLMTETLAYVTFTWALYAMARAVEDPRPRTEGLALLALAVATSARTQLALFAIAWALAIVVAELSRADRAGWRDRLHPHRLLIGMGIALGAVVALASVVGFNVLGGYEVTTRLQRFPPGLWDAAIRHAAQLTVGLGILPVVLFGAWFLRAAADQRPSFERALALVAGASLLVTFYVAGIFERTVGAVLQERYVIYAIPMFMIGAVALAADRLRPAPKATLLVATVATGAIVAGGDYVQVDSAFANVQYAGRALNTKIALRVPDLFDFLPGPRLAVNEALVALAAVLGAAAIVAVSFRARYLAPAMLVVLLVFLVVETRWIVPRTILGAAQATPRSTVGVDEVGRRWVDRAADGRSVALMAGRLPTPDPGGQWLWHQFWNKSLDRSITVGGDRQPYSGFPATRLEVDRRTGRLSGGDDPELVLLSESDPIVGIRGRTVTRSPDGAVLVEPARPLQATWRAEGISYDGAAGGADRRGRFLVFEPGARLKVTFAGDSPTAGVDEGTPLTFTVDGEGPPRRLEVGQGKERTVTIAPQPLPGGGPGEIKLELGVTTLAQQQLKLVRIAGVALAP